MSNAVLKGNASGTGTVTIESPNTNTDRTISLPDATGALVLSGTTPSFNGIAFPATQSASADANTLDDYEEGTWTPSMSAQTGSITSYTSEGKYVKIGRMVHVFANCKITNNGTATDNLFIGNYPFVAGSTTSVDAKWIGTARNTNNIVGVPWLSGNYNNGPLQTYNGGISSSVMATNMEWNISFTYQV